MNLFAVEAGCDKSSGAGVCYLSIDEHRAFIGAPVRCCQLPLLMAVWSSDALSGLLVPQGNLPLVERSGAGLCEGLCSHPGSGVPVKLIPRQQ